MYMPFYPFRTSPPFAVPHASDSCACWGEAGRGVFFGELLVRTFDVLGQLIISRLAV